MIDHLPSSSRKRTKSIFAGTSCTHPSIQRIDQMAFITSNAYIVERWHFLLTVRGRWHKYTKISHLIDAFWISILQKAPLKCSENCLNWGKNAFFISFFFNVYILSVLRNFFTDVLRREISEVFCYTLGIVKQKYEQRTKQTSWYRFVSAVFPIIYLYTLFHTYWREN